MNDYAAMHCNADLRCYAVINLSLFLTSYKENKNSLHVGALLLWANEQLDVDLDEIYLRNVCKIPVSNTAYLTLRSSHCPSTCRPAHMTPNFFFFVWRKLAVILYSAGYPIAVSHTINSHVLTGKTNVLITQFTCCWCTAFFLLYIYAS